MNSTKTTIREYRASHDEVLEVLGIFVSDAEEVQVSANAVYVFVTVTGKEMT